MSTAQQAARVVKELQKDDWKVLRALESSIEKGEFTPFSYLAHESRLNAEEVEFRLQRLDRFDLVRSTPRGHALSWAGYDALALKGLVDKELISGMGLSIGVGKESDVFDVASDKGENLAIKFYRIGRISFRDTKRKRAYRDSGHQQWLLVSSAAAEREFEALQKLYPLKVAVPHALARDRHAILMERIEGALLVHLPESPRAVSMLRKILINVSKAYKGGLINADLSEFNVLRDGTNIFLIDWPQAVDVSHQNAETLLRRDLHNILSFFKRRHGIECNLEAALEYVKGRTKKLEFS